MLDALVTDMAIAAIQENGNVFITQLFVERK